MGADSEDKDIEERTVVGESSCDDRTVAESSSCVPSSSSGMVGRADDARLEGILAVRARFLGGSC